MLKTLAIAIFLCCVIVSCKKNTTDFDPAVNPPDSVVPDTLIRTADNFAFCFFNVHVSMYGYTFLLQDEKVYRGYTQVMDQPLFFSATALPDSQYEAAKELVLNFPSYLEDHTDSIYGNPNSGDQGFLYIEKMQSNVKRWWILDPYVHSLPPELQHYGERLEYLTRKLHFE